MRLIGECGRVFQRRFRAENPPLSRSSSGIESALDGARSCADGVDRSEPQGTHRASSRAKRSGEASAKFNDANTNSTLPRYLTERDLRGLPPPSHRGFGFLLKKMALFTHFWCHGDSQPRERVASAGTQASTPLTPSPDIPGFLLSQQHILPRQQFRKSCSANKADSAEHRCHRIPLPSPKHRHAATIAARAGKSWSSWCSGTSLSSSIRNNPQLFWSPILTGNFIHKGFSMVRTNSKCPQTLSHPQASPCTFNCQLGLLYLHFLGQQKHWIIKHQNCQNY